MANPRAAQLVEAGMWLRLSGDHEGAKRLFDQALKLDPENARAQQLLMAEAAGAPPAAATQPTIEELNPFAPPSTSTSMDLDWGSATGFAPTPVPFIPPVEVSSTAVTAPVAAVQDDDLDLPVEFDIESIPPPALGEDHVAGTLQFGLGGQSLESPPPAPTIPEHWEPEVEEVAWAPPSFEAAVVGRTMQFGLGGQPLEPPTAAPGGKMQIPLLSDAPVPEDNWGDVLSSSFSPPPAPAPSEPKFAPNATSAWDQRSNPGISLSGLTPSQGGALDLASAARPTPAPPSVTTKIDEVRILVRGAKDLLGLDDHTGAMDLILKAQEMAPNDPEVQALRTRSEGTLEAMFESKLGKLTNAPRVKLKDDEIIWLNLDHRAGFVLAQIDGQVTFEDLFSVSGMSRLDTARILAQLIEEGVITS